jgi:DNA polymerase-3 subunit beta
MHFKAQQEDLARAVTSVARAVSARSSLPVLANVLVSAEQDGRVRLQATDLEIGMTVWIPAKVEEEGSITLPGRMLSELVSQFPAETVEIKKDAKIVGVRIKCGRYETHLKGIEARDFPVVPSEIEGDVIVVGKEFAGHIRQVLFAASIDESRPALSGVYMRAKGNELVMATTDGFRLAEKKVGVGQDVEGEAIVPRRAMVEIERLIKSVGDEEDVRIGIWGSRFGVATESAVIVASVVDANFPNYVAIIPTKHTTRVTVDAKRLLSAVGVSGLFARDSSNIVRFDVGTDAISVQATSAETGDSSAVIDAQVKGQPMQIAFNGKYLQEAVQACQAGAGRVVIDMTRASAPGLLYPEGDVTVRMVVMPMHYTR